MAVPTLFDPVRLGAIHCPNRILMAPMTRARATRDHVPTPIMTDYYRQRASAGLIITEATGISREGTGWTFVPGLWTEEQVEAWKPVTDAVHEAGGRIVVQLWHMGRLVHPSFIAGAQPVSASATRASRYAHTYEGKQPYALARALSTVEIGRAIDDFAEAAKAAMQAGFDGAQLHAANGYLIDQFLRDSANLRDDDYGGPAENRVRFLREATKAVADTIGAARTSVRLSPNGEMQGVNDSEPERLFPLAARELSKIGIGFLEVREPTPDGTFGRPDRPPIAPLMRPEFDGPLVLNSDLDKASGQAALDEGVADAIAYGRLFIACPDLPAAMRADMAIPVGNQQAWYTQDAHGYSDYPPVAVP